MSQSNINISKANDQADDAWLHFQSHSGQECEVYENDHVLIPELEIFGLVHFNEALPHALHPDTHPDSYEIHFLLRGDLSWWIGENSYHFRAGTMLIIRPGERHGAWGDVLEPCQKFWIRVCIPEEGPLPGLSNDETLEIKDCLDNGPRNVMVSIDELKPLYERLLLEHRYPAVMSTTAARGLVHLILSYLSRAVSVAKKRHNRSKARTYSFPIRRALDFIQRNETSENYSFSIKQLAEASGMSEGAFRKCFAKEVGFTPVNYLNHRKIIRSKQLLASGMAITEVAHALHYCSSQYFATVFRKITGMTPSEFQGHLKC